MKSKWYDLKPKAIALRKQGQSLPAINKKLGIPKSTLSNWLSDITLTPRQKEKLQKNWRNALVKARKEAVKWHNTQKSNRLTKAKQEALDTISNIDLDNQYVLELALSILYLAEGSKKNTETALGSSDFRTLNFFLYAIERLYEYDSKKVRCELYLRADQSEKEMITWWSEKLHLPRENFKQVQFDKRSNGKPTYKHYKGVCSLRCGSVAIQRRLVYIAEEYFAIIGTI